MLHSRENKIPEAYQTIQKMLQAMRVTPSSPQPTLPPSIVQLLTHYNLRTNNPSAALQMLKRRRINAVLPHYHPNLTITK